MTLCVEQGVQVHVINVFTRSAYAPHLPLSTGTDALEAVSAARLGEDRALQQRIGAGCRMQDLDWTDAPVRLGVALEQVLAGPLPPEQQRTEAGRLAQELRGALTSEAALVFAPLALGGHVDHTLVRDAALLAVPCERLALYEDLPYAARLADAEIREAVSAILGGQAAGEPIAVSAGGESGGARKRELAGLYPSQIDRAVVDEIGQYTERIGGERFYACAERAAVSRVLPRRDAEQPQGRTRIDP